jgi:mannose-6-phosphate isomerase-like protein (cupin superfamily)
LVDPSRQGGAVSKYIDKIKVFMKIIRKSEARAFRANESCVVVEYPMGDKDINGALALISGRYPSQGFTVNEVCRELGFVVQGSGKVVIEGEDLQIREGDLVCIDPGEKFYWEGNMTLFLPCAPAWDPKQHKFVE